MLPLEVKNLHYQMNGLTLLRDINFVTNQQGVTVLMGPNGAGKSLLLRQLHGLLKPTRGSVLWQGQPPRSDIRRKQAMLFQRPVLLRRSVQANIEFMFRQQNRDCQPQQINELLQRVGLDGFEQRPARKLSGGEQQRLALARALALNPQVLLMDEPSASLDPASTATIESIVDELKASQIKVFFVTHDVTQARRLADEVLFMHQGQLLEQSAANVFFNQPKTSEARKYLAGDIVI